uniref:Uncharacterized protein n=1 Tax=Peronospora matthiolae TaxID=2874970 RepID=A0AAV1VIG9_9STRA
MRCAAMTLCSTCAWETRSPEPADVCWSAAFKTQSAAVTVAGACGDGLCDFGDYELELIIPGEYYNETDLKKAKAKDGPELDTQNRLSRFLEALKASQSAVTSSERPTNPTLRLRDGVVRLTARKAVAPDTGTILTVMQTHIRVRVIGTIIVLVLLLTLGKKIRIVLLLRSSRGYCLR